jgi:hypothetical protein
MVYVDLLAQCVLVNLLMIDYFKVSYVVLGGLGVSVLDIGPKVLVFKPG